MNDYTDLIDRLRYSRELEGTPIPGEAVDAIEELQAEVARLKTLLSAQFGPASKPPLQLDPAGEPKIEMTLIERKAIEVLNSIKGAADGGFIQLSEQIQMQIDVVLMTAAQRRVGVA